MERFGKGDMNIKLNVTSNDEIGKLAASFNSMVISIKEKLEMQKFISNGTMKMIKSQVVTKDKERSQRKKVTLFFSDIRGFTSYSEKKDPADVVEMLNNYLNIQVDIIKECGGDIDKFVGDEIVAVFESDNMCDNAVKAAIRIQEHLCKLNLERESQGYTPIHIGIGINYGEVIAGCIGSLERMDYTVIGDAVNTASRLCSNAGKGEIIISDAVYQRLTNKKNIKELTPIYVKGKSEPIRVFKVEY